MTMIRAAIYPNLRGHLMLLCIGAREVCIPISRADRAYDNLVKMLKAMIARMPT